jgi:hypothetical protein
MSQPKELKLLWLHQRDLLLIAGNNACHYARHVLLTPCVSQLNTEICLELNLVQRPQSSSNREYEMFGNIKSISICVKTYVEKWTDDNNYTAYLI